MENSELVMTMREDILNLEKFIIRTPLISLHTDDHAIQSRIYLKPENLQILGSYKIRGVVSVLKNTDPQYLRHGLSVASAGNMAQAAAFAAQQLRLPCRVYVPESAPLNKKLVIKKLSAEIIQLPYEEVWKIVRGELTIQDKSFFIHPALNEYLLKGYATIADEIIEDAPDADAVVIPFGVGGLSLGISNALRQFNSKIAIYTCEPETACPLKTALQHTKPITIERTPSFVDAIGTPDVLAPVFQQIQSIVNDSLVMSLPDVKQALKILFFSHKLVCEGAAACSLAAAMQLAKLNKYNRIVCILSGGNIDIDVLNESVL